MTINLSDNDPRINYTVASGVTQSAFVVPFEFFDDDDLNVYVADTLKTLTTHYTTSDNSGNTQAHTSGTTGYIHFTTGNEITGAAGGTTVVITRNIDLDRVTDFPTSGPFDVASLNTELDRMIGIAADLKDEAERSLRLEDFDTSVSLVLPTAATRASKFLAFNSTGAAIASSQGSWQGNWSSGRTYAQGDLIKDTSTGSIYIANTSHTSSGSQPITTNTDSAKWDQVIDATSITTSETNAANSATAAAGSATAAAASALDAAFADDWAVKTDGVINDGVTTDYSSKAYAIGGTGVTDGAGLGPAKDWAIETTGQVDGTEYSAKEYAIGTQTRGTTGSAKDWATYTAGTVNGSQYSAKYWAEQAAASADNVDDLYLGPKSADPTVDNDGDALTTGDLYFNTNDNVLKVYDGTNWNDAAADTTSFATNGFSIAMAIAL